MERRPEPGDIGFTHSPGFIPAMIRLGERLRSPRQDAYYSHAFIVVEPQDDRPRIVQAIASGVVESFLSDIGPDYFIVPAEEFPVFPFPYNRFPDRRSVVAQAYTLVGAKYGWLTILSIALNLLTPKWVRVPDFRRGQTFICSAAAAYCLHAGGADIDTYDIYQVFPSELRAMARTTEATDAGSPREGGSAA